LLAAVLFFLMPFSSQAQEVIQIGGTGSALGSMKALARAFEKSHGKIKVIVMPSLGSGGAIKAVSKGSLSIGVISRALTTAEMNLDIAAVDYAETPLILVVRKDNPVADMSIETLEKIYRGEMRTWPNGERVRLVVRPINDADIVLLKKISSNMSSAVDAACSRVGMLKAITDQENTNLIMKTPGAIGFSTLTQVQSEKSILKILLLNSVRPGLDTLADGSYPHAKKLSMITAKKPSPEVRQFLDFVLSMKGQAILRKTGNVPLHSRTSK
jgi:phosphate transport system substrate-binding protein